MSSGGPINEGMNQIAEKKLSYSVGSTLSAYLDRYGRSFTLPAVYQDLLQYQDSYPLFDKDGEDTLWKTLVYSPQSMKELYAHLTTIYALLKAGDTEFSDHLYIERVDYCEFGNSKPFRVRVVNQFNDNYDHFYVKVADASRIYGLELEHNLSPNRINYLVNQGTLIEEHIAGVPGDIFIDTYFKKTELNRVRIAKEFVKFTERCFIRLLGDMRSYNYVVDITPDFEEVQYRVRAIDFDQQSYEGSKQIYHPQFYPENADVVALCTELLNYPTMKQYQWEERNLIKRRVTAAKRRLDALFQCMREQSCSTPEKIEQLAHELSIYHKNDRFQPLRTMGDLVEQNLKFMLSKTGPASAK